MVPKAFALKSTNAATLLPAAVKKSNHGSLFVFSGLPWITAMLESWKMTAATLGDNSIMPEWEKLFSHLPFIVIVNLHCARLGVSLILRAPFPKGCLPVSM